MDGHSPTFTAVLESSSEARLLPRRPPRLKRLELLGVRRALAIEARCGWPLMGDVGGVDMESMVGGAREVEHLWHWRPGEERDSSEIHVAQRSRANRERRASCWMLGSQPLLGSRCCPTVDAQGPLNSQAAVGRSLTRSLSHVGIHSHMDCLLPWWCQSNEPSRLSAGPEV
jgi:hypothetical protein